MGQKKDLTPNQQFIITLRSTLNHLYDPNYLLQSKLANLFGLQTRFDVPSALQSLLIRAIEKMKPAANEPDRANSEIIYQLLLFRYIQQVQQDEIAHQLGISVRHFRRQQDLAVYSLASRLWEEYHLDQVNPENQAEGSTPTPLNDELEWLKRDSAQNAVIVCPALSEVLQLIQPLAELRGLSIRLDCPVYGLAQVHPVAFQQIFLSLLGLIVQRCSDQQILIETSLKAGRLNLNFQARIDPLREPARLEQLEAANHLAELSHVSLSVKEAGGWLWFLITCEMVHPIEVLVIDDNQEIITMMQRFSADTRYHISGLSEPNDAINEALRIRPDMVIMDIMMPQLDGFHLLSRFKHHPELSDIPVIICSVLPQKDLATALGATCFLEKPFQREIFLTIMEQAGADLA